MDERDASIARSSRLLDGLTDEETQRVLGCVGARVANYGCGEVIYAVGERAEDVLMVLSGELCVVGYDYWGNRTLHARVRCAEIFGAAYGAAREALPVAVETDGGCRVLRLRLTRLLEMCGEACGAHRRVLSNIVGILSRQNVAQMGKMGHVTQRNIRDKALSYLSACSAENGKSVFVVPLTRAQMADYLAVDRAALSRTLSRLQRDGVIRFKRNKFWIL